MSDHDRKTEELKALLRQKLEGLPPAEDGWNVPSPGVWTGLSEEVRANAQPKTSKNWVARLATIIAALVVILGWRECSNQRQLTSLKLEVEKASKAYHKLQETCNERQSGTQSAGTDDIGQTANGVSQMSEAPKILTNENKATPNQTGIPMGKSKVSKNSAFPNKTTHVFKNIASDSLFENKASALPNALATDLKNQATEPPSALIHKPQQQRLLNFLPLQSISNFDHQPTAPKLDLHLSNPKDRGASVQFVTSLLGGLALTGNQLTGQKPAIIRDQKAMLTWRSGIGLEVVFNRHWSVISGLDYSQSRIETDYSLAVPYTHTGEFQHDDGNFDNQYNHSLPSPLGNYPLQLVLTRESTADVEEGEVMNLDLAIKQKTRFLSLPLQLRYGLGKHRWQVGAKAGIIANHVLGIASEKPTLHSNHGAIHERQTTMGTPPLNDLEKWTLDYALGLDLRYQLLPRLVLSMSTGYQRGITPIYKDDIVKNYLQAWNLGAGVHYSLR